MTVINFEQLSEFLKDGTVVLVDVRNPNELEEDGKISGSFNIPLPEVSSAFQMDSEDFKEKYGFEIPNKECENLIISCRSGKRAFVAKGQLEEIGYKNIKVYEGSFLDWKAKGGDIQ